MVLKANDRRTSCPCHDEFRGPRSDYVRQVALATTTNRPPELGHIYRYLENLEDSSVNGAICENWSRDFRLVEGLFYAKYATSLGEMRVYIPQNL
ncbi:hypothetical protein TNCV_3172031 [Trichonephila clavipes]|nr:hypothetical protein TNCV_3172031 [Trichonephila clavipes]